MQSALLVHVPEVGPFAVVVVVRTCALLQEGEFGQRDARLFVVLEFVGKTFQSADQHAGPAAVNPVEQERPGDLPHRTVLRGCRSGSGIDCGQRQVIRRYDQASAEGETDESHVRANQQCPFGL